MWYDSLMPLEQSDLMYNPVYLTKLRGTTTHQYYDVRSWRTGSLVYDGQVYDRLNLLYDIERDQLVLKHPNTQRADGIELDRHKLDSFDLEGRVFRKYSFNGKDQFFQVLYAGDQLDFVTKRQKKSGAVKGNVEFKFTSVYFIVLQDSLVLLQNNGTIKKMFPSLKKDLQEVRKREGLRLKLINEDLSLRFMRRLDEMLKPE